MPAGTIVSSGLLVSPGGQQGIPGPNAVSTDAANAATWGSDGKLFVPWVPTGVALDFAGSTAPVGFLLCDGTSYATSAYPALFNVLGYTWGGSGANFNVPDSRGRASIGVGQGSGLTNRTLAATGGEEAHAISIAELAVNTHTQNSHTHTDSGHTHSIPNYAFAGASGGATNVVSGSSATGSASANIQATTATNQNTGSGTAHNTMMPFIAYNKIIKT